LLRWFLALLVVDDDSPPSTGNAVTLVLVVFLDVRRAAVVVLDVRRFVDVWVALLVVVDDVPAAGDAVGGLSFAVVARCFTGTASVAA